METSTIVILEALTRVGTQEYAGKVNNNPLIVKWIKKLIPSVTEDEVSWCSAAAFSVIETALPEADLSMVNASARSWLKYGEATTEPIPGDVVIFWRESLESWKGHVSFFVKETDKYIWVLGGNQGNSFNISPYEKSRLLGYRRHIA